MLKKKGDTHCIPSPKKDIDKDLESSTYLYQSFLLIRLPLPSLTDQALKP
jgi:hypothetical protein